MEKVIRKITIGVEYKNNAMHYSVGQKVWNGHEICDIIEEKDRYDLFIRKDNNVMPWKSFNKSMAISIEYDITY